MNDLQLYNTIFDEFCEWIAGIEEEDPLPYEIKYIYFVLSFKNNINSLEYCGCEHKEKIFCSCDYTPLESQFFDSREFLKLKKQDAKKMVEIFCRDILNFPFFQNLFFDKDIKFVVID